MSSSIFSFLNPFSKNENWHSIISTFSKHAKKTVTATVLTAAIIGSISSQNANAQNTPSHIHNTENLPQRIEQIEQNEDNVFMQYDEAVNLLLQNLTSLQEDVLNKARQGQVNDVENDIHNLLEYFRTMSYNLREVQNAYEERERQTPQVITVLFEDVDNVIQELRTVLSAIRSLPTGLNQRDGHLAYQARSQRINTAKKKAKMKMRSYTDILGLEAQEIETTIQKEEDIYTVTVIFTVSEN